MPLYGFECPACGHRFDRLQKLSDPDPEQCPACAALGIRRQLTAPAFRLSGSGWYETDFKKDGDKKRNLTDAGESKAEKSEAPSEATAESKADTSAPAKTETKTESKPAATPPPPTAS